MSIHFHSVMVNSTSAHGTTNPSSHREHFKCFMGKDFDWGTKSTIEKTIYAFFDAVRKSQPTGVLELKIREFHPINLQALLVSSRELAIANKQREKTAELTAQLRQIEQEHNLEPIHRAPKFNPELESNRFFTILSVVIVVTTILFLPLLYRPLKGELKYSLEEEKDIAKDIATDSVNPPTSPQEPDELGKEFDKKVIEKIFSLRACVHLGQCETSGNIVKLKKDIQNYLKNLKK